MRNWVWIECYQEVANSTIQRRKFYLGGRKNGTELELPQVKHSHYQEWDVFGYLL